MAFFFYKFKYNSFNFFIGNFMKPATVAQHAAHSLVVGKVIGSNLGLTPRQN